MPAAAASMGKEDNAKGVRRHDPISRQIRTVCVKMDGFGKPFVSCKGFFQFHEPKIAPAEAIPQLVKTLRRKGVEKDEG
jgi:hypothetical protein